MKIAVAGAGYVGLVTAACLADMGNDVICVDIDEDKIKNLNSGIIPIYEPGLEMIVARNRKENKLAFTTDLRKAIQDSEIIFICVGTPPKESGEADLSHVEDVVSIIVAAEFCLIWSFQIPSMLILLKIMSP